MRKVFLTLLFSVFMIGVASAWVSTSLNENVLFSYNFDNYTDGTLIRDVTGGSVDMNATINNISRANYTNTEEGIIRRAVSFTGTTTFKSASNTSITGDSSFSYNLWANITSTDNSALGGWSADGSVNNQQHDLVYRNSTDRIGHIGRNNDDYVTSVGMSLGNWYMITVVYDNSTSGLSFWINGSNVGNGTPTDYATTNGQFTLGQPIDTGSSADFSGMIDEYSLWSKALNSTDISELYRNGDGNTYLSDTTPPNLTIVNPSVSMTQLTFEVDVDVADDTANSYCYFNITRGASQEVANTEIPSCDKVNTTVSSDSTDYTIWVFANDTWNNVNTTSFSFNVNTGSGGSGGGGGGGGASVIIGSILETQVFDSICIDYKKDFVEDKTWDTFWNLIFCRSAASIVPI